MKEAFYFSHDYNARNDPKLQEVLMAHGAEGMGVFWCIIEQLYEQDGKLPIKLIKNIAYNLHTREEVVQSVVSDFNLFEQDETMFWSNSVLDRLMKITDVREKRKKAIKARWDKQKTKTKEQQTNNTSNTEVIQMYNTSNTNVEQVNNKCNTEVIQGVIQRKEKNNKESTNVDIPPIIPLKGESIIDINTREDEFFEEMKTNRSWQEQMCMKLGIKPDEIDRLIGLIDDFILHSKCTQQKYLNRTQAFSHFNNWVNKEKQLNEQKKKQDGNKRTTDKRTSTDVSAKDWRDIEKGWD